MKECFDISPYRQRGWIEYRVLGSDNLKEAELLLQIRLIEKRIVKMLTAEI
jgi:hypothetical protein